MITIDSSLIQMKAGEKMTEKLLTPTEARQLLRISKSTLYRLIQSSRLPAVRVGSTYRIRMSELEEYLNKTRKIQEN